MEPTPELTALKHLQALAAKDANPIRLAKALAALDDESSKLQLSMKEIEFWTERSTRTLAYLRSIGRRMSKLGLLERHLINIGWTKAIEIVRHCEKETLREALKFAEDHTVIELRRYFKGRTTKKAKDAAINLRLNNRQYKVFKDVLLAHGATLRKNGGLNGKESALTAALKKLQTSP